MSKPKPKNWKREMQRLMQWVPDEPLANSYGHRLTDSARGQYYPAMLPRDVVDGIREMLKEAK